MRLRQRCRGVQAFFWRHGTYRGEVRRLYHRHWWATINTFRHGEWQEPKAATGASPLRAIFAILEEVYRERA